MYRLIERVEFRSFIAPRISGAIIGADLRQLGDLRLYKMPVEGERGTNILDYNCRASGACAMDVELTTADID